jgi:hypothetical protein
LKLALKIDAFMLVLKIFFLKWKGNCVVAIQKYKKVELVYLFTNIAWLRKPKAFIVSKQLRHYHSKYLHIVKLLLSSQGFCLTEMFLKYIWVLQVTNLFIYLY